MKRKRILSVILTVAMILSIIPFSVSAMDEQPVEITPNYEWYGAGTAAEFTISTVEDLAGLAKLTRDNVVLDETTTLTKTDFAGKTVKLGANLTFADDQYWYFNDGTTKFDYIIQGFAGSFDGNGKTITNLKIKNTVNSKGGLGLFSSISGSISDLTLNSVTGAFADGNSFGLLSGSLTGTATDCHVSNVTVTSSRRVASSGMMFGSVTGSAFVTECTVTGVTGTWSGNDNTDQVGALIGVAAGTAKNEQAGKEEIRVTISDCSVSDLTFSFTRKTKRFGAFIGKADYTDITNCNASNISIVCNTYSQELGGFVGYAGTGSAYNNCHVTDFEFVCDGGETLEYTQYAGANGGFVGYSAGTDIRFTNCTVTGLDWDIDLGADYDVALGGFAGQLNCVAVMEGCSASGTIEATGGSRKDIPIGGFIGESWNALDVDECIANVAVTTTGPAGGFIGASKRGDSEFTNCEALGNVESIEGAAGGFVGTVNSGTYENCSSSGDVTGVTAGGFGGAIVPNTNDVAEKTVNIDGCTANGTVTGSTVASGFVGHLKDADENDANATTVTISNSTAAYDLQGDGEKIAFAKENIAEGSGSHYISTGNSIRFDKKVTLAPNSTIVVGENTTVSVNVEGTGTFNAAEIEIKYPDNLEYVSSSIADDERITASNGTLKLVDYGADKNYGDGVYTFTFKAIKGGTANIELVSAGFGTAVEAETENLAKADCTDVRAIITVKHKITLDTIYTGDTSIIDGNDYTFTVEESTGAYYDYNTLPTAKIDGADAEVIANADGSWTVKNVNGELVITGSRTPKVHNATVDGQNAGNDGTSATYLTDYKFTLKDNVPAGLEVGYDYTVESITIGGEEYTDYTVDGRVYTILGADITGDIVVKVKTTVLDPNKFSVTVVGNGAGAATLSTSVVDINNDVTLTVPTADGYVYTVTAGNYAVEKNGDVYTVKNVTTVVEFNVSRVVDVEGSTGVTKAEAFEYVQLNGTKMWLVTIGDELDGKVYTYDGQTMFWSDEYETYATLVVAETTPVIEAEKFDIVTANASTVSYSGDVNMTGKVDANDAQLVWNMYEAKYSTLTSTVTLGKFLRADVNGDKVIDVKDATAIVNDILSR